jgi:hypothetical protein
MLSRFWFWVNRIDIISEAEGEDWAREWMREHGCKWNGFCSYWFKWEEVLNDEVRQGLKPEPLLWQIQRESTQRKRRRRDKYDCWDRLIGNDLFDTIHGGIF